MLSIPQAPALGTHAGVDALQGWCCLLDRLAAVELVDAHLCAEPSKYLAALLLSLGSMLHLELPHVNVLSKADLVEAYGELRFNLDFYTEVSILMSAACHCLPSDICVW